MKDVYFGLLKEWCDALISLQFRNTGDKTLEGGFFCRSCKMIHGRSPDALYPLVVMAKYSGEKKYLEAAEAVFDWGENMLCTNGAMYNDAQSTWQCITTFNAISLCEALVSGDKLLSTDFKAKIEHRLLGMSEWLYRNLDENYRANINYPVTTSYALALAGKYFSREDYLARAKHLADYSMKFISENGFLIGEGHPRDRVTPLGCRAVDMGYNMEESIPALVKYAYTVGDEKMLDKLSEVLASQLDFMLPDGAWDNSFGTRNNKWTYWGSRTSDGCAPAMVLLSERNPVFREAVKRNTDLLIACTHGGLLYGGPHYYRHGEYPCTHHTFEHANAIAFALEHSDGIMPAADALLPCDSATGIKYYPEVNVYKLARGDYRATVSGYDFNIRAGVQSSGGTLTMLWKYGAGPMIAASVCDYRMVEVHNMQLPLNIEEHRCLTPRLETTFEGKVYSSPYFTSPELRSSEKDGTLTVSTTSALYDYDGNRLPCDIDRTLEYSLSENGLIIKASGADGANFVLPLICGEVKVNSGRIAKCEKIFFLTGGFIADEYTVEPDNEGRIEIQIK